MIKEEFLKETNGKYWKDVFNPGEWFLTKEVVGKLLGYKPHSLKALESKGLSPLKMKIKKHLVYSSIDVEKWALEKR